jgi:hypothetical protein
VFHAVCYLALSASSKASIALALSGAALLWSIIWSIWLHFRTSRPRLSCRTAIAVTGAFTPGMIRQYMSASAANTGAVPVTLNMVTLRVRGLDEFLIPMWVAQNPQPLAAELNAGSGHWTGFGDLDQLRHELNARYGTRDKWRVRAVFTVAGDRKFKTRSGRRRWKIFPTRWTTI